MDCINKAFRELTSNNHSAAIYWLKDYVNKNNNEKIIKIIKILNLLIDAEEKLNQAFDELDKITSEINENALN